MVKQTIVTILVLSLITQLFQSKEVGGLRDSLEKAQSDFHSSDIFEKYVKGQMVRISSSFNTV